MRIAKIESQFHFAAICSTIPCLFVDLLFETFGNIH